MSRPQDNGLLRRLASVVDLPLLRIALIHIVIEYMARKTALTKEFLGSLAKRRPVQRGYTQWHRLSRDPQWLR